MVMIVDIASAEDEELRDSVSEIDIHAKILPMEAPFQTAVTMNPNSSSHRPISWT